MVRYVSCVLSLLALQIRSSLPQAAPTDLERGEIAPYTVVKQTKGYEIRSYPPANWVCRDHLATSFRNRDQAMSFFDLFDYISGQNSQSIKIDMTAPVTVYTSPNSDEQGNTLFQMCFYVPSVHQADTPAPAVEGVYVESRPAMTVAARRFGGFVKRQQDWEMQMELLKTDLKTGNEANFDFDSFYGATYDAPFKMINRRNEVWLVKMQ